MPEVEPYEPGAPCWVGLASPDPEAAKAFYHELLGWDSYTYAQYRLADYTHFTLAAGGPETAGMLALADDSMRPVWTAYFTVTDIAAAGERVLAAGGRVHAEPVDAAHLGRLAICADAKEIGFGLWQPYAFHGGLWQAGPGTLHRVELACPDVVNARRFYSDVFGWKCDDVTPSIVTASPPP
jgi:predicted enzyme related to lactoylglutathione lyase